jgi:PAS domain S-box-containing protein
VKSAWIDAASELESRRILQSFSKYVPGALFVYQRYPDATAKLHYISDGAEAIFDASAEDILINPAILDGYIHPDDKELFRSSIEQSFRRAGGWKHEYRIVLPRRGVRYLAAESEAELQADGSLIWYGHISDVTSAKEASNLKEETFARFQSAIEKIGDGAWFYDVLADRFSFSNNWWPILGYDAAPEDRNQMSWIDRIDPAHQQSVLDATDDLIAGKIDVLSCEYRIRIPDGSYRWLHARGAVTDRTPDGRSRILSGTFADVSDRKEFERQIRVQSRAMDAAPIGIFVADASDDSFPLLYLNPSCQRAFGLSAERARQIGVAVISLAGDPAAFKADLVSCVETRQAVRHGWSGSHQEGSAYSLRVTITPVDLDADQPRIIGIVEDITSDQLMRDTLVRAREDAIQANLAKSRFIAHVSHELRTPLHGIMGLAELMEQDWEAPSEVRSRSGEINKAAGHLLRLIGDIIDLSAIETGRLALSVESVEISRVIDGVMQLALPVASRSSVALYADARLRSGRRITVDATRATQVLLNLVSNGIKYNRPNGHVALRLLDGQPGMLRIGVEDTGPGLSTDAMDQLFDQFNRLGREMTAIEGSGIGLTIAKSLTEAMGGTLGVSSAPGQGSTFWVEFALAPDGDCKPGSSVPAPPAAVVRLEGLRVLVAEDNLLSQSVFQSQLDRLGCIATIVGDGLDALREWLDNPFDALLTDVHMPSLDGLGLATRIREIEALEGRPRTYIVGVSANAMKDAERSALAHGMDAYATKPLTLESLQRVLASRPDFVPVPASTPLQPGAGSRPDGDLGVIDTRVLERLVGDDPEMVATFLDRFVSSLDEDVDALVVALRAGAVEETSHLAHRLRSAVRTVGALELESLLDKIEREAGLSDMANGETLISMLDVSVAKVRVAVAAQRLALAGTEDKSPFA